MKFDTDDIQEIIGLIQSAEVFRPIVDKALETVESFGPEFKKIADLLDEIKKFAVQSNIRSFEEYLKAGLSREEALLLTLDARAAFQRMANKQTDKPVPTI